MGKSDEIKDFGEYKEYYEWQYNEGLAFQDFAIEKCYENGLIIIPYTSRQYQYSRGESINRAEIKFDKRRHETRRLYIEIAEKANPNNPKFVSSGIYRNDNSRLFVIGDYSIIYVFPIAFLRKIHQEGKYEIKGKTTSKGFCIPERDAQYYAELVIQIEGNKGRPIAMPLKTMVSSPANKNLWGEFVE